MGRISAGEALSTTSNRCLAQSTLALFATAQQPANLAGVAERAVAPVFLPTRAIPFKTRCGLYGHSAVYRGTDR